MTDKKPDIAALMAELHSAMEQHKEAEAEERRASSAKTAATNRLNHAQKALDEFLAKLRGEAPWGSDWHSKRLHGERAA